MLFSTRLLFLGKSNVPFTSFVFIRAYQRHPRFPVFLFTQIHNARGEKKLAVKSTRGRQEDWGQEN
jgi:hypothetical protein